MVQDLFTILYWWLILFGAGLVFLPLTYRLFSKFWDLGYAFSKVLGILLISYVIWLLGSLKLLPFSRESVLLVTIGWLVFNLFLVKGVKGSKIPSRSGVPLRGKRFKGSKIKIFVAEELLFLACLIFWSFIRGFQPDIQGLEKFMDFGFVNSILRTKYFPPADMWFAGGTINYYYFGHFITALLTKLSGLDSAITYNLQIATLFALAFTTTFSLTSNLLYRGSLYRIKNTALHMHKVIIGGLIAAFLLTLGGNFHSAYYNFKMKIAKKPYCNGSLNYWYPDATRFIGYCPEVEDKTIHEFPSYSFVVSDLHGHVSDIPFVMLFLALVFKMISEGLPAGKRTKKLAKTFFIVPLLLATMYITNAWDLPIYFMVLSLALLWLAYQKFGRTLKAIFYTLLSAASCLLLAILFSLPFQLKFEPIAKGVAFVNARSLVHQLLILWGAPWLFCLTFVFFLSKNKLLKGKIKNLINKEVFVQKFSNLLGVKIKFEKKKKVKENIGGYRGIQDSDHFVLVLIIVSTLLVIIPEIIYVKDIYIPSYHRANTMFKLTYQAFMMYSIAAGYIIIRVLLSLKKGLTKKLLATCYLLLVTGLMIYPYFSIKSYYGLKIYRGLYGLKFLKRLYPDNYQAVLWLNRNVSGQPVILEAAGDSYTDYNQISMATGLPTIEGWLVHEWLWRGSFDEPGKRASEVQQIYEGNTTTAKALLAKYQVKYVIASKLEREKYKNIDEEKFDDLGKTVFESGETKIFEISN